MINIHWLLIALLHVAASTVYAEVTTKYWQDFSKAKGLMEQNKPSDAIPILLQLEQIERNYNVEIILGDSYATLSDPSSALDYYESAYQNAAKANNEVIQRVALFKIARMQLWLKKYQDVITTYQHVLAMKLSDNDKVIARTGLKTAQEHVKQEEYKDISSGNRAASEENPNKALNDYESAYQNAVKANNEVMQRVALFKIAHTQFWLKRYQEATTTYQRLLGMKLTNQDKAFVNEELKTLYNIKFGEALEHAIELINKNNGKGAYELIASYLGTEKNFKLYLVAAQSMAIAENPEKSLNYFNQAYFLSHNNTEKKTALFGMVKMQLWLRDVTSAQKTIFILRKLPLDPREINQLQLNKSELSKLMTQLKLEHEIQQARQLIKLNNGQGAYELVKGYLYTTNNYQIDMIAAESMAIMNNPKKALTFYNLAFSVSSHIPDQIAALFGIAKMQFSLSWYVTAGNSYNALLKYKLSPKEHELALAGLVKSLAYYDRPRLAYKTIPQGMVFTTPQLVIAAAQASLWSNWANISKYILTKYQDSTKNINLKSGLGKDLLDAQWQTDLATWPNVVTPTFYFSSDSETFNKKRVTLDYIHYWRQEAQTFMGLDYIRYTQYRSFQLNATGFYIGETLRPNRYLILKGQIEPFELKNLTSFQHNNWSPFLWNANGSYTPNDFISVKLLAQKELIETFPAFYDHITDNQYAASLIVNPLPYVTLNGSYTRLDMSDTNYRNGYYLSASLLPFPDLGLNITGVLRGFFDKFRSPDYFSPYQYKEEKVVLKLGRRLIGTWHYYVDGGLGTQYITPDPNSPTASSPTYQWGLGINGPLTHWLFLTAYYAKTHQASAFINSTGYSYQYGAISLNILLS